MSKRKTAIFAAALVLVCAAGYFYFKYMKLGNVLAEKLKSEFAQKLKRQISLKSMKFSAMEGFVISKMELSDVGGFSKGKFFVSEKITLRPEIIPLIRNRLVFKRISLRNPEFKIKRNPAGKWNFADLLALLPQDSKGLHLAWNAKEVIASDAKLEFDDETSGHSISMENASLEIFHYSSFGGNFSVELEGKLKTALYGSLFAADAALDAELNFEYAGLSSSFGKLNMANASFGEISIENTDFEFEFFGLNKDMGDAKHNINLKIEGLLAPGQSKTVRQNIFRPVKAFFTVIGKKPPEIDDLRVENISFNASLDDRILNINGLNLNSNLFNSAGSFKIDGNTGLVELQTNLEIGGSRMDIKLKGPPANPDIKPELSQTARENLISLLKTLNKYAGKLLERKQGDKVTR
ncbi:MAG: hypothetical protein HY746_03825 [Elusimicrobia bacterium]|nr:hypothetical protein [Elusimicrobiota bacterium]